MCTFQKFLFNNVLSFVLKQKKEPKKNSRSDEALANAQACIGQRVRTALSDFSHHYVPHKPLLPKNQTTPALVHLFDIAVWPFAVHGPRRYGALIEHSFRFKQSVRLGWSARKMHCSPALFYPVFVEGKIALSKSGSSETRGLVRKPVRGDHRFCSNFTFDKNSTTQEEKG